MISIFLLSFRCFDFCRISECYQIVQVVRWPYWKGLVRVFWFGRPLRSLEGRGKDLERGLQGSFSLEGLWGLWKFGGKILEGACKELLVWKAFEVFWRLGEGSWKGLASVFWFGRPLRSFEGRGKDLWKTLWRMQWFRVFRRHLRAL